MDTLLNREIKGYAIRERLGSGGFGAVYRAVQPSVGREVAIKVILPQFANQPEFVRRFEVEAQVIARLEHPHIVPLYDYWRDPDGAYLVMRMLRSNLRISLERSPWNLEAAVRLLEQVTGALTIAHREGIVHRDIKPDNILLDEDENAYLADFGIAKDVHLRSAIPYTNDEIAGSPAYLSPEQIRSDEVTPRTDLYSLGYVLYELLTGEKPFRDAKTPSDYIMKHLSDPMPMLSIQNTHIPAAIDEVLQTVTAKVPSHRYASALRFAAAFRAAIPNRLPRIISQPLADPLTERQLEVLRLIIEGLDNQQIAQRLFLTPGTVKWYIKQVYSKLDAHSRQQAVERALSLKLNEQRTTKLQGEVLVLDQSTIQGIEPPLRLMDVENPYKGLRAFQERDASDFYGRAALTERLLSRMIDGGDAARVLTVVGPSGSGKSSVVRAGLIPALRKGALIASPHPFIADFMPGTHPLEELEAALLRVAVNPMPDLLEQLQTDRRGLVRAAKRLLPNDFETELILVVDQFEELFTLVTDEALRVHFIDNLLSAATDPRGRIRIILTLRADFYDRPLMYPRLAEMVRANTEVIIPLNAREMEQAITAPLERIGMSAENGLTATILHDVGEQPGTLPLLQYTLTELFEQREGMTLTLDAYKVTGGVLGALTRRAEGIYNSLDVKSQQVTPQLFLRMVTLGEGTEDTRRRVLLAEFTELANETSIEDVLNAFAQYRLLTLDRDPLTREPTVEIAHEALIREWSRMREWLNESREEIRLQRQLMLLAEEWQNAAQDVSFLLRGSRLELFEKWVSEAQLVLTQQERKYLQSSLSHRAQEQAQEDARRSREIALEKRSRNFLRGLVAVLLLATLGAFGLSGVALNQRNNAQRSSDQFHSLSLAADSQLVMATRNNELALNLGLASIDIDNPPARAQLALSEAAYAPGTRWLFHDYSGAAPSLTISPDGRYAAVGMGRVYTTDFPEEDNTVRLLDLQSGQQIRVFEGHVDTVSSIAFSAGGHYLLTGSFDILSDSPRTSIILWDVDTGEELHRYQEDAGPIGFVAFSPDESSFLSVALVDDSYTPAENGIALWDIESGTQLRHLGTDLPRVIFAAFSPDGHYVVIRYIDPANEDGQTTIVVYDTASGERLPHTFLGGMGSVNSGWMGSLIVTPNTIMDVSEMVRVWDIETGALLHEVLASSFLLNQTASILSLDGRTAAFGETGGRIQVRDVATWQEITTFIDTDANNIFAITFADDGTNLLSSAQDGVRFWNLRQGALVRQYGVSQTEPLPRTRNVLFMPNGQSVLGLSSGIDTLMRYDRDTGELLHSIVYPGNNVTSSAPGWGLDVTPDGLMALIGTAEGNALLYDLENGTLVRQFSLYSEIGPWLSQVAISPDGRTALTGAQNVEEGMVLWDLSTGVALHRFLTSPDVLQDWQTQCSSVAFDPTGSRAVVGCSNGTLIFYDLDTYAEIRRFVAEDSKNASDIAFSPDGRTLLTANFDNTLTLWDVESETVRYRFVGHSGPVRSAAFSPDGRLAVSGSTDSTIILWDVSTGQAVRRMSWLEGGGVFSVTFSPDGQYVLAGGLYGIMSLWRVDETLDDLTGWIAANRYIPDLTCQQRSLYIIAPLCSASDGAATTP